MKVSRNLQVSQQTTEVSRKLQVSQQSTKVSRNSQASSIDHGSLQKTPGVFSSSRKSPEISRCLQKFPEVPVPLMSAVYIESITRCKAFAPCLSFLTRLIVARHTIAVCPPLRGPRDHNGSHFSVLMSLPDASESR